jgi:type II secretory pathway component PulM
VKAYWHQLQLLVARLSPREQRLVAVFASLLGVVFVWSLVIGPFLGGRERLRKEIDGIQSELTDIDSLAQRIRQTEHEAPAGARKTPVAADFSVLAFVEKSAGSTLRPESVASMTPARRPLDGGRQESSVELKLSAVSLSEVVALLHAIESEGGPVYVKQFSIKKRYDDPSEFDVTLVTAAALPA